MEEVISAELVRLTVLLATIAVGLGPLSYGLYLHGWNIASLVTPKYTPPRIDFDAKYEGLNIAKKSIVISLAIENRGELTATLQDTNLTLYGPDGAEVGRIRLENPLRLNLGEKRLLNMTLNTSIVAPKISSYFTNSSEITLSVRGILLIKVLGTDAMAPLNIDFKLSREQLRLSFESAGIRVERAFRGNGVVKFVVRVSNQAWWEIVVEKVDAKFYGLNGSEISPLTLEIPVTIEPSADGELTLIIQLNQATISQLTQHIATRQTFTVIGTAKISILGLQQELPFKGAVAITKELLRG